MQNTVGLLFSNVGLLVSDVSFESNGLFAKCFTEFSDIYSKYIFVIRVKGLEPATSCVRDQDTITVQARYVYIRGRIFKLSPIHALVIFTFPESSAHFQGWEAQSYTHLNEKFKSINIC